MQYFINNNEFIFTIKIKKSKKDKNLKIKKKNLI